MVESSQFFLAFRHALEVLQVCYRVILKGLSLAMDLAFDDRCSNYFYNAKSVFIAYPQCFISRSGLDPVSVGSLVL